MSHFIVYVQNETTTPHQIELAENDTLCLSESSEAPELIFIKDIHNELCVRLETASCVCLHRNGRILKLTQGKPCRVLPDDSITSNGSIYRITRITNRSPIKRCASSLLATALVPLLAACSPTSNSPDQNAKPDSPAIDTTQTVTPNSHPGAVDPNRHTGKMHRHDEVIDTKIVAPSQERGKMPIPPEAEITDTTNTAPTDTADNNTQPAIDDTQTGMKNAVPGSENLNDQVPTENTGSENSNTQPAKNTSNTK